MTDGKNPWTVLSKKTPYENAWIRVDHHEVLDGSGSPGIYGVVHFKNHAIGIVPIDERGNVILVGFRASISTWRLQLGDPGRRRIAVNLDTRFGKARAC